MAKDNEDSLLDFINEVFSEEEMKDDINIIDFYEIIDIDSLSPSKQREFLEGIDISLLTVNLWRKICDIILSDERKKEKDKQTDEHDEKEKKIDIFYDGNSSHRFHGIIHHLTEKCGGNVNEKGVVTVTASSNNYICNKVVDLDSDSIFQTDDTPNQWVRYDFNERRVRPTHYTIRTRNDNCDGGNPQNWVIEVSNSGNDNDWKIIESCQNVTSTQKAGQTVRGHDSACG